MKKILILCSLIALLSVGMAFSHEDSTFQEAKDIIKSEIPCSELTEEQLEHIGDYYMEQMHPGEAHEAMDEMMGGEGSESLRQVHIAMAKRIYCDDVSGTVNYGMMGMMSMMGGGMMNMAMGTNMMGNSGYGMMGNFGYGSWYLSLVSILYLILLIGLVILVYFWIFRMLRGAKIKGGRK